jgi:hypothetical protein
MLLISGAYAAIVRKISIALFLTFGTFSVYRAVHHDTSCGCFGRVSIPPLVTAIIDVACLVAIWTPNPAIINRQSARNKAGLGLALFGTATVSTLILFYVPPSQSFFAIDTRTKGNAVRVLEPRDWIGSTFLLADSIKSDANVRRGKWTVFLYSRECSDCQAVLPTYKTSVRNSARNVLLVEVPPIAGFPDPLPDSEKNLQFGRLDDMSRWFVVTPTELCVVDDKVVSVREAAEILKQPYVRVPDDTLPDTYH